MPIGRPPVMSGAANEDEGKQSSGGGRWNRRQVEPAAGSDTGTLRAVRVAFWLDRVGNIHFTLSNDLPDEVYGILRLSSLPGGWLSLHGVYRDLRTRSRPRRTRRPCGRQWRSCGSRD